MTSAPCDRRSTTGPRSVGLLWATLDVREARPRAPRGSERSRLRGQARCALPFVRVLHREHVLRSPVVGGLQFMAFDFAHDHHGVSNATGPLLIRVAQ